jgi:hypothetical protein
LLSPDREQEARGADYAEVVFRPELHIRKGLWVQLLQLIKSHSHIIKPSRRIETASDPDDNMFLESADAARGLPDYWHQRLFPAKLRKILADSQKH